MKTHHYNVAMTWTGNTGHGTKSYQSYKRDHEIQVSGKPVLPGSSDPLFRGNRERYNPEEMLVASVSSCHMLWYLHLCSVAGIVVTAYKDMAIGEMNEKEDGSGFFTSITLKPEITITDEALLQKATELHHDANQYCFIANSVNFPVHHQPVIRVKHDL